MKKVICLTILFLVVLLQVHLKGQQKSIKWFDSEDNEGITDIIFLDNIDQFIFVLGKTSSYDESSFFSYLLNTRYKVYIADDQFNLLDSLKIEESDGYICMPHKLHKLNNGQILIHGIAYDSVYNDMQLYLLWLDNNLNIIKDSLYGEPSKMEFANQAFINSNGNFILHGVNDPSWMNEGKDEDVKFFWEFDATGQSIQYVIDLIPNQQGMALVPLGLSGKYHLTRIDSITQLNPDFSIDTVYSFNLPNFNIVYTKYYQENKYLILGWYFQGLNPINPNIPDFEIGLINVNSEASILNLYFYGTGDTSDIAGGFDFYHPDTIFLGGTKHVLNGPVDNWIEVFKTDLSGQKLFEFYYGGFGKYWLHHVIATEDGGCVVAGTWWDFYNYPSPDNQNDAFIMKIGPDGIVTKTHNIQLTGESPDVFIYPNPGKNVLSVSSKMANLNLRLFDQSGRFILEKHFDQEVSISTSNLETGTYIYFIYQYKKQVKSGKWVKTN